MFGWPGFSYIPSQKICGLYREIRMPANLTSANHIASFQGRKPIQIEVVNNFTNCTFNLGFQPPQSTTDVPNEHLPLKRIRRIYDSDDESADWMNFTVDIIFNCYIFNVLLHKPIEMYVATLSSNVFLRHGFLIGQK